MTKLQSYTKFIISLVGFLLTTAVALDWGFEFPRWFPALTSLVTALGVFLFPNKPYVQLEDGDVAEARAVARRDDTDPL